MAQWQSKMSVVQTTQVTIVFIPSVQKGHDLYECLKPSQVSGTMYYEVKLKATNHRGINYKIIPLRSTIVAL
jgi:hypothetical protein